MKGTSIAVLRPQDGQPDRFGNVTTTYERTTVTDVLVSPGATAYLEASRPEGVTVAFTLHFPKTFTETLEGCEVELPSPWNAGNPYKIIGAPAPYMDENTPTRWHMEVEVESAHG